MIIVYIRNKEVIGCSSDLKIRWRDYFDEPNCVNKEEE